MEITLPPDPAEKERLLFDLFDRTAGEQPIFKFAVRSAFFELRAGENEAGVDDTAGTDFTVASSLNLNDQHIIAFFIEQSGKVKGERTGKALSHADIFVIAPDPDDGINTTDEKSGAPAFEFGERHAVPDRT